MWKICTCYDHLYKSRLLQPPLWHQWNHGLLHCGGGLMFIESWWYCWWWKKSGKLTSWGNGSLSHSGFQKHPRWLFGISEPSTVSHGLRWWEMFHFKWVTYSTHQRVAMQMHQKICLPKADNPYWWYTPWKNKQTALEPGKHRPLGSGFLGSKPSTQIQSLSMGKWSRWRVVKWLAGNEGFFLVLVVHGTRPSRRCGCWTPKIGGLVSTPPKMDWMVKIMEKPMNKWMIWWVFPLFLEGHPCVENLHVSDVFNANMPSNPPTSTTNHSEKQVTFSWANQISGQIIATSHALTPNGGLVREFPLFQGNPGWWNIIIWPDVLLMRLKNDWKHVFFFSGSPRFTSRNPSSWFDHHLAPLHP